MSCQKIQHELQQIRKSESLKYSNNIGSIAFGSFAVKIGNKTLNSAIVNRVAANTDLPMELSSENGTQ